MTASNTRTPSTAPAGRPPRWWRFGMVWFVIAGPALVVVAGFTTMAIAFHHADTELHEPTPMAAFSMRVGAETRTPVVAPTADPGPASPPPRP